MRSFFFGLILLLASTAAVHPAHAEKHGYALALITHRRSILDLPWKSGELF
jgi:hypothetical protein